jgi:transposase
MRCGVFWCARVDAMFNVPGMHVLSVEHERERRRDRLVVTVETDATIAGFPACGIVAVGHGRRVHAVADAPCFGLPTRVRWRKRVWRCAETACPVGTFSERHDLVAPRAKLTSRAIGWATDALEHDDTTVSALARHLGVDWHTCWDAIEAEALRRVQDPARMVGSPHSRVDEHIWRPSRIGDTSGR